MTIRDQKDATTRLEDIRFYQSTDPVFYSILNRVIEELEERDFDLDQIHKPSRGFRVRAQQPASSTVEIEAGVYLSNDTTIVQETLRTVAIPAAAVGNIRIDLISINCLDGSLTRTGGVEIPSGSGFGAAARPNLPPNSGRVPLAYVYVDETPTPFSDNIAINVAGHIQDIRPAPGMLRRTFVTSPAVLLQDAASASVGASSLLVRADHVHPANVDAVLPSVINAGAAGSAGTSSIYARRDHTHPVNTETVPSVLATDVAGGAVGVASTLPRADHRHPLNVDATLPEAIAAAGAVGTAATYARRDHVHPVPSNLVLNQITLSVPLAPQILGSVGRRIGPTSQAISGVTAATNMTSGSFSVATDRIVWVHISGLCIDNASWRIAVDGSPATIDGNTIGNTTGGWIGGPQQGNFVACIDVTIPIDLTAGTHTITIEGLEDPGNPAFATFVVEDPGAAFFMVYQLTGA